MKFSFNYAFIAFIFCFCSCDESKIKATDAEESTSLKGQPLAIESNGYPFITMLGDNLLIRNVVDKEGIFQLYNTEDFSLIAKFGQLGDGPLEHRDPIWMAKSSEQMLSMNTFKVYDNGRNEITEIRTNPSNYQETEFIKHPLPNATVDLVREIIIFNDTSFIYRPDEVGRFVISDRRNNKSKLIPFQVDKVLPIQESNKWQVYHSQSAVNVNKKLIVSSPRLLGQLDFFDFDGNLMKSIIFDSHNHNSKTISMPNIQNSDLKMYCSDIELVENSIYLLIQGRTLAESNSQTFVDECKILKFDWEGNFLSEYKLDHFATSFAVDLRKSRIYTYNFLVEENAFYSYSIE